MLMDEVRSSGCDQPTVFIIAGPNGAGKTTFALKFLPEIVGCMSFVNADEIARGLSPLDPEAELYRATKIFLGAIEERITAREDFAFETTLSGRTYLRKIEQWRRQGWRVELIYLYLSSVQVSLDRVRQRVAQGGHGIPPSSIVRRYPRSIRNLFAYAKVCDRTFCLDNSHFDIRVVFELCYGQEAEVKDRVLYDALLKEIG